DRSTITLDGRPHRGTRRSSRATGTGSPSREPLAPGAPVGRRVTRAVLLDLDETLVPDEDATAAALLAAGERARARAGVDPAALAEAVRARARALWRAAPTFPYCDAIGISSAE